MKRLCLLLALMLLCAGCSVALDGSSAGKPPDTEASSGTLPSTAPEGISGQDGPQCTEDMTSVQEAPDGISGQDDPAPPQSTGPMDGTKGPESRSITEEETGMRMTVEANGEVFYAVLEENDAAHALVGMMENGSVEIEMRDYSGFEKVGPLGRSLPTSNSQTTTLAGDIVLYNGDQIVIFYGSNSWSYTRIGHIEDLTGWAEALGGGDLTVRFSIEK